MTIELFSFTTEGADINCLAWGKGWIAVDKPGGLSIHNDKGNDLCSLVFQWLKSSDGISDQLEADMAYGVHAVHRIDRETSGVVLLGCRKEIVRYLSSQFENRQVDKRYIALLHGSLADENGVWDRPLSPKAEGRKNPAGKGKKIRCVTEFNVIDRSSHYTLVECKTVTGRKHQIRRHAKLAGHPVVGDTRYGSARAIKFLESVCSFSRLGLHSSELTIEPDKETGPSVIKSDIPDEMMKLIQMDQ